jgi:AGZA family xanthine/uracil permease-like MFS transporter
MATTVEGRSTGHSRPPAEPQPGTLDRYFGISAKDSSISQEVRAGAVTFLAMCYILFVNPTILKDLPFGQVLTVTAFGAAFFSIIMGFVGRKPFGVAAGLGLNAFVAFTLVGADHLGYPDGMGVIVAEGALATLCVLLGIRKVVIESVPSDLKMTFGAGIGAFILFIGLVTMGVVVKGSGTLVGLAPHLGNWHVGVGVFSLLVIWTLSTWGVKGSYLYGIVLATVLAMIVNKTHDYALWQNGIATWPSSWTSNPDFGLVGHFSFNFVHILGTSTAVAVVLSAFLSDFFDTAGTGYAVGKQGGLVDSKGNLENTSGFLLADSLAAMGGGMLSASSNTTYIESGAGVGEGGRTGLTAVVIGLLFACCLFFSPVAGVIPAEATAGALVMVGVSMLRTTLPEISWTDPLITLPAVLGVLVMPLTYNITNGVGVAFVTYSLGCVITGQFEKLNKWLVLFSGIFVWYFVHGVV